MEELDVFGGQSTNDSDAKRRLNADNDKGEKSTPRKRKQTWQELEENEVAFDYDMDKFHESIIANKSSKDSVFVDLFGQKEYLLQLYQTLHPEDLATQIKDLEHISLRSVIY